MREFIKRFSLAWCISLVLMALLVIIFDDPYEDVEGTLALFINALVITTVSYVFENFENRKGR